MNGGTGSHRVFNPLDPVRLSRNGTCTRHSCRGYGEFEFF